MSFTCGPSARSFGGRGRCTPEQSSGPWELRDWEEQPNGTPPNRPAMFKLACRRQVASALKSATVSEVHSPDDQPNVS